MYYKILVMTSNHTGPRIYSVLRLSDNQTFTMGDIVRIDGKMEVIRFIGEDTSEGEGSRKYGIYFTTDNPGWTHHWLTNDNLEVIARLKQKEVDELLRSQRLDIQQLNRELILNQLT